MPEEIRLDIRIYDDRVLTAGRTIKCAVDYSPRTEKFRIVPLPMQVEDALVDEMLRLEEYLVKQLKPANTDQDAPQAKVPALFYGSP